MKGLLQLADRLNQQFSKYQVLAKSLTALVTVGDSWRIEVKAAYPDLDLVANIKTCDLLLIALAQAAKQLEVDDMGTLFVDSEVLKLPTGSLFNAVITSGSSSVKLSITLVASVKGIVAETIDDDHLPQNAVGEKAPVTIFR